jgi:hypothetical protein
MRQVIAIIVVAAAVSGCGQLNIRLGSLPPMERLERDLVIGQSTRVDIERVLGRPTAEGRSLLPVDPEGKTYNLWTYYYAEAEIVGLKGKDARGLYLYIYLDGDRYQGYLWFSSLRQSIPGQEPAH